jgi:hypothetical protein
LAFDSDAGAWRLLDGRAEDYLMRDTRSMVMRYVRDYPGQRPKQIAEALQLDANTVRQTCRRMTTDRQLRATPGGQYHPASDSGDSSDTTAPDPLSLLSQRHSALPDQPEPV